jgi:ubiquinone/menaquinone biosynthesis C-methylase UbiE
LKTDKNRMKVPIYQKDLSLISPILLDRGYKQAKVDKMLAVLQDAGILPGSKNAKAVDIGCSRGLFAAALAGHFHLVLGLDIDANALQLAAAETPGSSNLHFVLGDSLRIPVPDSSIDLLVCNNVYEHVPDAELLFSEIYRVLKPFGMCYLGVASRLTLIEPHYHLPFLSWLPKTVAHWYVRAAGKGRYYYETMRTYQGIRRLISRFKVTDYTLKIVADPDRFKARDLFPAGGLLEKIPLFCWRLGYSLLPSYIFILRKE